MIKPIRILHITQRMEAAGVQTFLMNIYRKIDRERVQFDFLVHYTKRDFYDDEIESLGGKVYRLSVREDYNLVKYKSEIHQFFQLHSEYRIVHGHMETLSNVWEKEAFNAGIPFIITHAHTADFSERNPFKLLIKQYFRHTFGRYSSYRFACSDAAGCFMFGSNNYTIIPNAIDLDKFRYDSINRNKIRNDLGIHDKIVIGSVGRFHRQKNYEFLVRIAREMISLKDNTIFIIVGDGDLRETIDRQIIEYGLKEQIILLGNRNDVYSVYSAMDVFLMPSLVEGLPLVGVEAQATGLPCLFSDSITKELGITDRAFYMSLDETEKRWAERILELSSINTHRIEYKDVVRNAGYDINCLVNRISSFYEELVR